MKHALAVALIAMLAATAMHAQVIYNSASTAGEGYQRGMASVIQSQGQRNLSNSQAAINLTDARSAQIDNQVKSVNAFWEKKDIYDQRQQQEFAQIGAKRSAYMERHGLGYLTPEEFDRTTGVITWPRILDQKAYDPYRTKLDELFKDRAYNGALTGDQYMEATNTSKEWRAAITKQRNEYPAPIFSQMLRFILKVNRELDDNLG